MIYADRERLCSTGQFTFIKLDERQCSLWANTTCTILPSCRTIERSSSVPAPRAGELVVFLTEVYCYVDVCDDSSVLEHVVSLGLLTAMNITSEGLAHCELMLPSGGRRWFYSNSIVRFDDMFPADEEMTWKIKKF